MKRLDYESLKERIKKNEGFRAKPYFDSLGVGTIGYGITWITENEADMLLSARLQESIGLVEGYIENEGISIDDFRLGILAEMVYQLGFHGLLKFKKMWRAIRDMDYEAAAAEMKDSRWFKQTPVRAGNLADKMARGY